ncbi:hypothetical protein BGZ67_009918, partial [Mortierella alpina]
MKFSNSNTMKYLLSLVSSIALVALAGTPVGASPANALASVLPESTVELSRRAFTIDYEVYEQDGCSNGSSTGLCGGFECRDQGNGFR